MIRSFPMAVTALLLASWVFSIRAGEAKVLNVRDFGAVGDGKTNDTPAINRAIVEGARVGPGTTVTIPQGRYLLSAGPEFGWGEGPAINHLAIRNNRFVNCNSRGIDIAYCDGGDKCIARNNRDILIVGNTFTHWGAHGAIHRGFVPQCPIRIRNATGVVILEDSPIAGEPTGVLIVQSEKVELSDNKNLPENAIERR